MLVARALDPQPGERVLDLCAAPGGKTTHLAALMGKRGRDHRGRARPPAAPARWPAPPSGSAPANVQVEVADAALARPEGAVFDRVLVDPPCSGLGMLQARPDLRWRATPQAISQMAEIQARILGAGAEALRPGGVLVYSTCTISPTENERVIAAFLESRSDFGLDDLAAELPALALRGRTRASRPSRGPC